VGIIKVLIEVADNESGTECNLNWSSPFAGRAHWV